MTAALQVVWFKRDLRVHDHPALISAAQRGPVLPLYIVEPEQWRQSDASARQWMFVADSLRELRASLAELGQPLIVRVGHAINVLEALRRQRPIAALWSHQETGNNWTYQRDRQVAAWATAQSVAWHEPVQCGVTRRLASRDGWARRWDKLMAQPVLQVPEALPGLTPAIDPGDIPDARALQLSRDDCPGRQAGGRHAAVKMLQTFLDERGRPYRRAMSGPVSGAVHCSRLSPHLAFGTLSVREVTQVTADRQRQLKLQSDRSGWRPSLKAFQARLHWRGHFMQKLEDEPAIEYQNFHRAYDTLREREPNAALLTAWCCGQTGLPFVDACMRALQDCGWMNFRMRAMLVSVAANHLWLDWQQPGEHLARLFTDYEPGIHWSQMQMQSGTSGINTIRIYNPVKQGHDQDPDGSFIRRWIPELADVPDAHVHEPWRWEQAGRVLDKVYPFPVVDYLEAARSARQKVWAIRDDAAFRRAADHIQEKHGSRKSGIRQLQRKKVNRQPVPGQLSLGLDDEPA